MADSDAARTVILHVSDTPEDLKRATDAARGIRDAYPGLTVRVIINGDALASVAPGSDVDVAEGVEVQACSLGLARRGFDGALLPDGVSTVPAAVTAIVEAQQQGALYVRI